MTKRGNGWRWLITVVLVGVILYCGAQILMIVDQYRREATLHQELLRYRPDSAASATTVETQPHSGALSTQALNSIEQPRPLNQGILDLRARNADVVGWLTILGTVIDYPFVQAADNNHYLARDINGDSSAAGTLFLDCRNDRAFSDFSTIIYGHHMKNGSMFGQLARFIDEAFFTEHRDGTIWLEDRAFSLEIFACMLISADNEVIYQTLQLERRAQGLFFDYVAQNAQRYREIGLEPGDLLVTLSTCAYDFSNARYVVIARMTEENQA